jgi:hypothetical protein
MFFDRASWNASAAFQIKATAFRNEGSAELVMITELSFDRCQLSSSGTFTVGERLRLHLAGQGWIEAQVDWISGDQAGAAFVIECNV